MTPTILRSHLLLPLIRQRPQKDFPPRALPETIQYRLHGRTEATLTFQYWQPRQRWSELPKHLLTEGTEATSGCFTFQRKSSSSIAQTGHHHASVSEFHVKALRESYTPSSISTQLSAVRAVVVNHMVILSSTSRRLRSVVACCPVYRHNRRWHSRIMNSNSPIRLLPPLRQPREQSRSPCRFPLNPG